jgi:hypothetical protein
MEGQLASASSPVTHTRASVIRYRFEFIGVRPLPAPDDVRRDSPVVAGAIELYAGERFLVESVDHDATPPAAVLRKVRS